VCRFAKEKQLRIWKDYQPPVLPASVPIKTKEFTAKVIVVLSQFLVSMRSMYGLSPTMPLWHFISTLKLPKDVWKQVNVVLLPKTRHHAALPAA